MKKFAKIENKLITNIAKFNNDADLPDGWVDVTEMAHAIGWPMVGGTPIEKTSSFHTLKSDNSGWELTAENQAMMDSSALEAQRISEIESEKASAGLKKISVADAYDKIDQIFADKTTVAQLRTACIQAFKILVPFILR